MLAQICSFIQIKRIRHKPKLIDSIFMSTRSPSFLGEINALKSQIPDPRPDPESFPVTYKVRTLMCYVPCCVMYCMAVALPFLNVLHPISLPHLSCTTTSSALPCQILSYLFMPCPVARCSTLHFLVPFSLFPHPPSPCPALPCLALPNPFLPHPVGR